MKQTTKQAIQASFRTLLLAKSLDKITVRDIVEDCGLTRNTFYYHYEDIYDLFDDYLDTCMYQVWQSLPPGSRWNTLLLRLLDCLCETPQMGRHIFFSNKRDAVRSYLNKILSTVLDRYIDETMQGLQLDAADRRLICDTCTHALYGLIEQSLTGPDAPLLRQRLSRVTQCFEGGIRSALEYCAAHSIKEVSP